MAPSPGHAYVQMNLAHGLQEPGVEAGPALGPRQLSAGGYLCWSQPLTTLGSSEPAQPAAP